MWIMWKLRHCFLVDEKEFKAVFKTLIGVCFKAELSHILPHREITQSDLF